MTYEEWTSVLAPKVQGTLNLHTALDGTKLRFFVAFSSISGVFGNAGQANYAAANVFLDSFMRYRRSLGLAGSVIDIGLMEDVGHAYESAPKLIHKARSTCMQTVKGNDLLNALELALHAEMFQGPTQFSIGLGTTKALSNTSVVPFWGNDARFDLWANTLSPDAAVPNLVDDNLRNLIESIQRNPAILDDPVMEERIIRIVSKEVASRITNADDMDENEMANVVIESLAVVEVRVHFRKIWGLELQISDINKAETTGGLGKLVIKSLKSKYHAQNASTEEETLAVD